jgi:hypothetical protein
MMDETREGSRRIADGNPAVAQGANDEPFQDSDVGQLWLSEPLAKVRQKAIRFVSVQK